MSACKHKATWIATKAHAHAKRLLLLLLLLEWRPGPPHELLLQQLLLLLHVLHLCLLLHVLQLRLLCSLPLLRAWVLLQSRVRSWLLQALLLLLQAHGCWQAKACLQGAHGLRLMQVW